MIRPWFVILEDNGAIHVANIGKPDDPAWHTTHRIYGAFKSRNEATEIAGILKTKPLHPESMHQLRALAKLHGITKLRTALHQIEQELDQ